MATTEATAQQRDDPYWSRRDDREEIAERVDPVVWGDDGPLSGAERAAFARRGFLVLDDLFTEVEAREFRDAAACAARRGGSDEALIREIDSDEVRSVFNPHHSCPELAAMAGDRRLVDRIRQILGGEAYIHQFRINFKPPFAGREFAWHSDFETWHVEDGMPRMRAVSAVVMLDENNHFNGPLLFIPGSHRRYVRCAGHTPDDHYRSSLRRQEYGVPSRAALAELAATAGVASATGGPGTVVLFDCNLMHASTSNFSPYPRTNAFMVFNSCENRLAEPFGGVSARPDFLGNRQHGDG
jgi:ectoine hydroxylase